LFLTLGAEAPAQGNASNQQRPSIHGHLLCPFRIMAGLVPAIHAFASRERRGCPAQGRA
jgi:hypothetical protein